MIRRSRLALPVALLGRTNAYSVAPSISFSLVTNFRKQQFCFRHCRRHHHHLGVTSRLDWSRCTIRSSRTINESIDEDWIAGNVHEDIRRLECALALSQAEQNFQFQERCDVLDYFAQQRRIVKNDVWHFVLLPLTVTFLMIAFNKMVAALKPTLWTRLVQGCGRCICFAFDLHFLLAFVFAPLLLRIALSQQHGKKIRKRSCSSATSSHRAPLLPLRTSFAASENISDLGISGIPTSCEDHVVCLVEQWLSASLGVVLVLPFVTATRSFVRWVLTLFTKLSVLSSLHQFPSLWYQQVRSQKRRPQPWSDSTLQYLCQARLFPHCVIIDLVRLGMGLSWSHLTITFGIVLLSCTYIVYKDPERLSSFNHHPRRLIPRSEVVMICAIIVWFVQHSSSIHSVVSTLSQTFLKRRVLMSSKPVDDVFLHAVYTLTQSFAIAMAFMGPWLHFVAFRRLIRVSNSSDVSLADLQDNGARLKSPSSSSSSPARERMIVWRWRTQWRTPRRILDVLKESRGKLTHWFIVSGSVEDKLRLEIDSKLRSPKYGPAHQQGLAVLQRVARERASLRPDTPAPNRTLWKKGAMDRLASLHQKHYSEKTMNDPLGIALYKSLGIGLGFNFDYMTRLSSGERPSLRRLQSRAAKSAIRRVQELSELSRKELALISDQQERERRAHEIQQENQAEIDYMAERLTTLIPLDMSLDNNKEANKVEQSSLDTRKGVQFGERDRSQAIEYLFEKYSHSQNIEEREDFEFLEEWERQRYKRRFPVSDTKRPNPIDVTLV